MPGEVDGELGEAVEDLFGAAFCEDRAEVVQRGGLVGDGGALAVQQVVGRRRDAEGGGRGAQGVARPGAEGDESVGGGQHLGPALRAAGAGDRAAGEFAADGHRERAGGLDLGQLDPLAAPAPGAFEQGRDRADRAKRADRARDDRGGGGERRAARQPLRAGEAGQRLDDQVAAAVVGVGAACAERGAVDDDQVRPALGGGFCAESGGVQLGDRGVGDPDVGVVQRVDQARRAEAAFNPLDRLALRERELEHRVALAVPLDQRRRAAQGRALRRFQREHIRAPACELAGAGRAGDAGAALDDLEPAEQVHGARPLGQRVSRCGGRA